MLEDNMLMCFISLDFLVNLSGTITCATKRTSTNKINTININDMSD